MNSDKFKRMTNEEFVSHIMNYSNSGSLVQSFVIEALRFYSEAVISKGEPKDDGSFINPVVWYNIGKEVNDKINLKYSPNRS